MLILDGKKINQEIASELSEAISELGETPQLVIIQVGENPASDIYIQRKADFGQEIGVKTTIKYFSENVSEEEVLDFIQEVNNKDDVNGILVQLPLPKNLNKKKILEAIKKEKDVDGLNNSDFVPATTRGVLTLLQRSDVEISDKKVVIINDSDLIGKPTAREMERLGAEVIICNEETENIKEITKTADILITAIGKPEIIDESYLSNDQIVIDIGISKKDSKIFGDLKKDLDTEKVELKAASPVPGGVGPMTVASLFQNLIEAVKNQQ